MPEPKHTPGPWEWQDWNEDGGPNANTLVGPKDPHSTFGLNLRILCADEVGIRSEADKRLIRAAPEMYELLKRIKDAMARVYDCEIKEIEAVLAKVEGRDA